MITFGACSGVISEPIDPEQLTGGSETAYDEPLESAQIDRIEDDTKVGSTESVPSADPEDLTPGSFIDREGSPDVLANDEHDEPAIDVLFDYLRAVSLLNAGQYKEAVGRYNVVLRIHPDLYLAYHGRALAYYNEDFLDLALKDFDRAIEIKPDYAEALRNRGVVLGNQGLYDRARDDLSKAVELYRSKGDVDAMREALKQLDHLP